MADRPRVAFVTAVDLTLGTVLRDQLRYLRDAGFEVSAVSAPGPWVSGLKAEGLRHHAWSHITRSWDLVADVRALVELVRILRAGRYDIVHTHTPKAGFIGRLAARIAGVPVVVNTVHGFYVTPEDRAVRRLPVLALEQLAARLSDLELYVSEEDLRWARRIGVSSGRKSALVRNGINLREFDPRNVPVERVAALRSELDIPATSPVVGTIGRLVKEKGIPEFAEAARSIHRTMPDAVFLAVGSPDADRPDAIDRADLNRFGADVRFIGWRDDVRDLLAAMDVFVLASRREGLPISAIHAAAMARPLVLTDIRGCREIVQDGRDGLLVPPGDPRRLERAIRTLLEDEGLRTKLGARARRRCVSTFSERRVGEILVRSYESLLANVNNGSGNGSVRDGMTGTVHAGDGHRQTNGLRLRAATAHDAPSLARLHRDGLTGSFLPQLGDGFLRIMYRAMAADSGSVTVVAEDGDGIVGFAAGVLSTRAFYRRFILRHGLSAGLMSVGALVRPGVLGRLAETVSYPSTVRDVPAAELVAIVVDPARRARGVGR
jgi:glycosyltransferase involved in cell wall biosynthesis